MHTFILIYSMNSCHELFKDGREKICISKVSSGELCEHVLVYAELYP